MLVPWFDVDAAFALLGHRGLDGRHGLRTFDLQATEGFRETEEAWSWTVDLPGVRKENVSVTVENGQLLVRARHEGNPPIEGTTPRYLERRAYEVRRTFRLPDTVNAEGVSATYEHGVLTVNLPKRERPEPRQIEVQVRQ
jgi:HSP20 family protein